MQTEPAFRVPESLAEAIAEHLGLAIADGRLRPGQRLVESQLCKELSVSRTPLREALRRLSAEGLIELSARRGAKVAELTEKSIRDGFMVRGVLEGLAARLAAASATEIHITELRELNAEMKEASERRDARRFFELNTSLHSLIASVGDNPYLASLQRSSAMRSYRPLLLPLATHDHLLDSVRDHGQIIDAIQAGDTDQAEVVMKQHIANAAIEATRVMKGFWTGPDSDSPPNR